MGPTKCRYTMKQVLYFTSIFALFAAASWAPQGLSAARAEPGRVIGAALAEVASGAEMRPRVGAQIGLQLDELWVLEGRGLGAGQSAYSAWAGVSGRLDVLRIVPLAGVLVGYDHPAAQRGHVAIRFELGANYLLSRHWSIVGRGFVSVAPLGRGTAPVQGGVMGLEYSWGH